MGTLFFAKHIRLKSFFCLLLLIAILAVGCTQPPTPEIRTSSVLYDNTMLEYGNYIYISFPISLPYKYNRKTDTTTKLCMDVECKDSCVLCTCVNFRALGIQDNKLYFSCAPRYVRNPNMPEWTREIGLGIGYQDQISGTVTLLKTIPEAEFAGDYTFWDQSFIYYSRFVLKEGGDPKNSDDYVYTITRISLDGKTEENLEALSKTTAGVLTVAGGNIYTLGENQSTIYTSKITDEGIGAPVPLFDIKENGYKTYYGTTPYYYNGTLFFLVSKDTVTTFPDPKYSVRTRVNAYLIALNTETGEGKQLMDEPIGNYTVTENKIYYMPIEFRLLYVPENYDELYAQNPGKAMSLVKTLSNSAKIYCCNLDGSDPKLVLDFPHYQVNTPFSVIDNTLYGWLADLENDQWLTGQASLSSKFASVNLSTGKVTFAQEKDNVTS